jgi:hypothetical protein
LASDEELNAFRLSGTKVRVIRDNSELNDVVGFVVAWNEEEMLIRKANRRVVKLSRNYPVIPADAARPELF